MTFDDCLFKCIRNKEFVKEFNRLCGCSLGVDNRKPIEKMIDEATGYQEKKEKDELGLFVCFVYEYVWLTFSE